MSQNESNQPPFATNRWRDRLIELEVEAPYPKLGGIADLEQALATIRARENELNCIYTFTQLREREHYDIDEFLATAVDVLPPWWQYPEVACARIVMGPKTFRSRYYQEGPWEQVAPIVFPGDVPGELAMIYTEDRPRAEEGPFLQEERELLEAVAIRLALTVQQKQIDAQLADYQRQLEIERTSLRESNTALRQILDRIEEDKNEAQREILDNMDRILMPIIRELEHSASREQRKYLDLLSENLTQITSPFIRSLTTKFEALTPTEVQICKLIRDGMGSKQIAELRGTSVATIHRHREHIRRKLGVTNQKVNLASYLQRIL